jgi:two-component system NtrC family sensor kinase
MFTFSFISGNLRGMKISIRTQLALIFLALACFIGVVTSLIINSLVTNQIIFEAQERVKEHLSTARWVYDSKIRDIDRTIRWTAIRHVLKRGIKEKNIFSIKDELLGLMEEEGLSFMTLVDRKGTVIYRFHNPKASGDSLIQDPFIEVALEKKGISGTQVLSGDELLREGDNLARMAIITSVPTPKEKPTRRVEETSGMVLKAAHPIVDFNGEVLGALTGGILLNRNYELVDRIKNIVFKDVKYKGKDIGTATIFLGDLRISTNVMDKEGNRAIGTRAMREVQEQVLGKGMPWVHRAFVVDDWYITAYEPIRDIQDKIVGMLYVGMMESKYALMKERLILLFFLFSMSGMLVALTVSFVLSWRILKTGNSKSQVPASK